MNNTRWYILLLLIVLMGDRIGGYLLETLTLQSQFRYSKLYEGEATSDILLLGNSRGLIFYQPYIEEKTGKTTCNLSYNGLPMDAARTLVLDYLDRYPAPKTLVIDITICDRENDALLAGFLPYTNYSQRLDDLIHQKLPKNWWGGQVSKLFCFNNEIFQRAMFYRNKTDKDWLLDRVIPAALAKQAAANSYDLEVRPYLMKQLKEAVETAQAKGVRVALVVCPYFPGFQVRNLDALISAAENATGLPVRDYRAALTDHTDFGDFMHPNKKGSAKYIDFLRRDGVFD